MGAFGDEHLFDELETVDDDARRRSQRDAENVAVRFAELRKRLERHFVLAQQVKRADDWPADWTGRWTPVFQLLLGCATLAGGRRRWSDRCRLGRLGDVRANQTLGFVFDAQEDGIRLSVTAAFASVQPDERQRQSGQCGQQDGRGRHEDGAYLADAKPDNHRRALDS